MSASRSVKAPLLRGALLPLVIVSFLSSLGFSIVMPFLVFLIAGLGGNAFVMGAIGASFSVSQLIGAPWLGGLSDRVGRKRVLLYSQLGGLLAWAIFAVALVAPRVEILRVQGRVTGSFVLLLPVLLIAVSRATDGLVNGSISVANAYLADVTTEDERKGAFAHLGAATSLGFVIGPLAAGFLARGERGVMLLVLVAAVLSAVGALVVAGYLPAVPVTSVAPASAATPAGAHKALGGGSKECVGRCADVPRATLLAVPGAKRVIALYFLVFLGFSVFNTALPVHALEDLGWSSDRLGTFFGVLSLTLIATQALALPPLSRRVGSARLAMLGSALVAAAYVLLACTAATGAFVAAVLYGIGNGLMWPSYLSILSETGPPWMRGRLQGVASSAGSVASIVGMLGTGSALEPLGRKTFLVAAVSLAVAAATFASRAAATVAPATSDADG